MAALMVVLAVGAWPYSRGLHLSPVTKDAAIWIARGALFNPNWTEWVFHQNHFHVGYRPLTALSYTLDYVIGGLDPFVYRATDLALHIMAAALVFLLYRRMAPACPAWGGWVAVGLFMAHAAVQDVVPYISRRSYTLATLFGLAALVVLCGPQGPERTSHPMRTWVRSLFGGLLLAAGALSHEVTFVVVPLVPLLVYQRISDRPNRWGRTVIASLFPMAMSAAVIILRTSVIGGIGGYEAKRMTHFWPIFLVAWRSLGVFSIEVPRLVAACFMVVLPYYLWRAVVAPLWNVRRRWGPLPLLLVGWLVGYGLLYAWSGDWFPREVYPMLVPFSLLIAVILGRTLQTHRQRPWVLTAHLAPQLLLLVCILYESPVLRGPSPNRMREWQEHHLLLTQMQAHLQTTSDPALVKLVLPYEAPRRKGNPLDNSAANLPRRVEVPALWIRALLHDRDIVIENGLVFNESEKEKRAAKPEFRIIDERPAIWIPPKQLYYVFESGDFRKRHPDTEKTFWLDTPTLPKDRDCYVYFQVGETGRLILIQARSE